MLTTPWDAARDALTGCGGSPMCHLRIVSIVLAFWSLVATASSATASNIAEKKFPFPSPLQWKSGKAEISLIALAWGPANSPEMISKGREKQPREQPGFFSDRTYAIALGSSLSVRALLLLHPPWRWATGRSTPTARAAAECAMPTGISSTCEGILSPWILPALASTPRRRPRKSRRSSLWSLAVCASSS